MDQLNVSVEAAEQATAQIDGQETALTNTVNHPSLDSDHTHPAWNKKITFASSDSIPKLEKQDGIQILYKPIVSRLSSYSSIFSTEAAAKETAERYANAPRESWKNPRENVGKLLAAYFEYMVHGLKDSSMGVLMQNLERHYHVQYIVISLAFLAPFAGYTLAACINDRLHRKCGRWGACITGIFCQLFFYICASAKVPFPLFVVAYGVSGIGSGIIEGGWNAWFGGLKSSPQVLGVLHGFYGIGGVVCPLVGNAMLQKGVPFNYLYVFITGCSCLSLIFVTLAFRHESPARYRAQNQIKTATGETDTKNTSSFSLAMKQKLVWFLALTIFSYVGSEVTLGGWSTTYMIGVIHSNRSTAEYVDTGYWAGLAAGRIVFAFVTGWVGHWELMVATYIAVSAVLAIINLTVKNEASSAACFALLGLFIGPLFPTMMAVATKKLPRYLHVSGIGFAAAVGGGGSAVIPFISGVLVQKFGPVSVMPLVLASLCAMFVLWLIIIKFC